MRYRIFIIGLDAIFSNEDKSENVNKLKILEMQTIYNCYLRDGLRKAVEEFRSEIKNRYQLKLDLPVFDEDPNNYTNYARTSSLEKTEGRIKT